MQTAVDAAFVANHHHTFKNKNNKTKLCREVTAILFNNQRSPDDKPMSVDILHKMERRFNDAGTLFDSVDVVNSFSYMGSLNRVLCEDLALTLVDRFHSCGEEEEREEEETLFLLFNQAQLKKAEACAVETRKADESKELATKLRRGIEAILAEAWSIESDLVVAQSNAAEAESKAAAGVVVALEVFTRQTNNNNKRAKH